jgi:hypothetical protein
VVAKYPLITKMNKSIMLIYKMKHLYDEPDLCLKKMIVSFFVLVIRASLVAYPMYSYFKSCCC